MAEITVDVGVRLKAMQTSVADLQKVLDGLQPNSSGFKALQKIIADINRDMDRLRIQTSKPFGSQNQFNQTEKTVDKLEESLEKVKITIDRIKFSDLKLDSSQTAQLDNFKQQLKDIKQEFTTFKADLKGQFLDNDFNKAFVEGINPNLLNKSFDEIVKNVENRVNSLGSTLAKAKADLENFQNAAKIDERISKASQTANGVVSPEVMGQEMFDKFFQTNSKGVFSFKTGSGLKKGEIQQQFLDYLAGEFQLTQSQIDQLKNQTAGNIRKILAQDDFFNSQKGAAETANKKMNGAESAFTTASKNYENAAAVVARLTPLLSALSNEELSLEDKQKLVNEAIRQFEQDCVNGAKGSKTMDASLTGLGSQLNSFKTQLGQVNVQWLNLQKQQATFNSMKFAIINFMGFNQVLNLTKRAVKEAMDHIKQLDTVMNGIAIVTDMTTADLWNQVDVYSEMAQRYGTSIQGAYEVSKIYYQAGYETNEVLTLMNETLKMSKISGLDYATTTDYMMNAVKGFKMEVVDAASVVDVYSALAANTAVSQQELAEAMSKTASSMAGVGSTFEDTSAMIATMVSVTRESANNIGSAMKSIASRYGELTKDPTKLLDSEGEAMSFNKVDTALKSVGITLQTTDHQFRDFTDVIVELANKWDTLDSAQQRYIATQFAGNRQQNRFLALVSNKDLLQENMEVAAASEDTGTLQALKALDSLESKLNQVQVAYQQFYTTIGVENVWKAFLDGTENVINTLNNLPKLFGKVPLGAVAVIYDIISLIKTTALNGLSEIASIWIQKTQEMTSQTQAESGKNRDNGTAWVDNFVSGISSGIDKIRQVAKEAVDAANEEAIKDQFKSIKGIDTEQFNPFNGDEGFNLDTYASGFESFYSNLQQTTNQFTTQQISSFEQMVESIRNGSLFYQDAIQQVNNVYQENIKVANDNALANQFAGDSALSSGQKFLVEAQGIAKAALSSKKLASTTSGLAMGLNTIAMLINTTSESGKRLAGTLMTVAGGLRAVGAVLQYVGSAGQMAFPWMAVITGVIGIINGISTAVETAQEKIERLEKEAEELNNEAKQAKAEYNTLQRTADKLDELKEKRYESAEAAEEYQSAVDDLASKFPEMIAGFDEAGNIILDTTDAERILAEAREKSKQATYNAAKAEMDAAQTKLTEAKESLTAEQLAFQEIGSYNATQKDYLNFFKDENNNIVDVEGFNYLSSNDLENGISFDTFIAELKDLAYSIPEDAVDDIWYFLYDYINDDIQDIDGLKQELSARIEKKGEGVEKYQELLALLSNDAEVTDSEITGLLKQIENPEFNLIDNIDIIEKLTTKIQSRLNDENLSSEAKSFYTNVLEKIEPLNTALQEVVTLNEAYKGNERIVISAWQEANDNNGKAWEYLEESSGLAAIVTKQIQSEIGDTDYTTAEAEQASKWKEYQAAAEQFYSGLSEADQKIFNQMIEDTTNYSGIDITKYFNITEGTDLYNAIINYYEDGIKSIRERLESNLAAHHDIDFDNLDAENTDFISTYALLIHNKENEFTKNEETFLNSILSQYDSLNKQGFSKRAETFGLSGIDLFKEIQTLPSDVQKSLINSILENGLTTKEGVQKILDSFKNDKTITNTQIDEYLEQIISQIINNVPLAVQTATSELLENWDDTSKELTKALSGGLEFKEAEALITKAESLGVSLDLNTDFVQNGDKLILTSKKFSEYWEKLNEQSEKNAEEWQADIDAAQAVLDASTSSNWQNRVALSEEMKASIEAIAPNFDWENYTEYGRLNLNGVIALQKAIQESSEGLERYNTYAEMAAQQLKQTQEWILGDYSSLSLSPEALKELSSGKTVLKREDYNLRAARENINSAYNSLISDVLSKGFDKINLEDYSGLIDAGKGIDLANTSYEDFVREYAIWAGKSIEETNSLIIQAIEKDTQTTTGAAAEAVGKIQWLSDKKGFASLGDIQSLADALGISVDAILGEYNKQLDAYEVDVSQTDLSKVDNFTESVYDSINEFLKKVTDGISKGISGKLSGADVTTLNGQLAQLGIEGLGKTDFTETAEGLKISQRAAIDLYTELKKIDALQGQLVFEDLAKSLEASDTNYTNISTTLARIAELEKAIKEMKPDDARLQMYKNELAVAQEIARTRSSTDNKDFNFMDRALPTGMQNPIDYWNATGEAYKAMNASVKSGYMEIQDFYNIVQEMSNMAQVSGQTLHFMGQEIDGSAETAAALIQRGFSALTNVKGDGVKIALGNIGADFKTGAADMKGDFDSGIKEMAKAQIQMLDAAINMLEAIVAMEDIDVDQDGLLEMGEIFNPDYTFTDKVDNWFTELDNLTGGIEIGGVDLKTALLNMAAEGEEGRQKVVDLLNQLYNIDWTLGDVNVFAQIQGILQAFYPGENITQGKSIFEMLEIPKNADKNLEEFKKWATDIGLSVDMADLLIQKLTLSEGDIADRGNELYTAIEKTLGLAEEGQEKIKTIFEQFTGDTLETKELKFWQNIDIEADENGNLTNATYQGSDGGSINLDLNNPLSWAKQIEDYEYALQKARQLGGKTVTTEDNETFTFKANVGMNEVVVVTKGSGENGTTLYQFPDWFCNASSMGEALQKYAEYKKSSNSPHYSNMSAGDILVELGYIVKESTKVTMQADKPGEDPQSKIDKLLKADKEAIEAELKKPENKTINDDGTVEWQINIGGETFKFTSNGQEISYETLSSQLLEQTGLDTKLIESIATAIKTAFTQDTSISEAIGQGIRTALTTGTDENGQPQEISIPTLNLKPESVTIQLGETEPTLEGSEESKDISISEVTLKPTTILVNTDGATASTEGETTPEVDVEGKITSYIDTGANTTALTAAKEIEGKIASYLDNGADVKSLTVAKDIDGIITSYLDTGADIKGLTEAIKIPGVIGSYTDPEANISGLTVANAIKAIIALYEESPNINDPSDYINDLTGEITSYSDANKVTKPEKIEGIIGYIKQYKNAEGTDPNNLLNNLTGTATITTNTPDINITTTAADTTWGIWKEKVENDPLQIGIQPTPSQGEIPSSNPTPSPSSTPTPTATSNPTPTPAPTRAPSSNSSQISNSIDTSSITSAFDSAINSVVTKVGDISTEADKISSDKVKAIQDEQSKIEATNVKEIGTEESRINYTNISMVKSYANAIDPAGAKAAQTAINAIPSSKNISIGATITVTAKGGGLTEVTGDGVALNKNKRHIQIAKTGNVALAAGRDTLMGELGPEMVVSHGRYFVVGQNGPEMVNLAEDAIVFNHLQTEQLLRHGKASGHAKPVTNERKATSLATGNVGPAMAGASAALEALKGLRAMWQSLLSATMRDMGAAAGGGGGGGGGGDSGTAKVMEGIVRKVEEWYNWLQKIKTLQNEITRSEKEYTLLEGRHASTAEKLENLRERYAKRQESQRTREDLAAEQEKSRTKLIKKANKGLMGAFYRADEKTGQISMLNDEGFAEHLLSQGVKSEEIKKQLKDDKKIGKGTVIEYQRSFNQEDANKAAKREYKEWLKSEKGQKADEKTRKAKEEEIQKKHNKRIGKESVDDKLEFTQDIKSGQDLMAELQKTKNGKLVHDSQEQWAMIEAMGFDTSQILADIDTTEEGWEQKAVEAFYVAVESDKEAIEGLNESIEEQRQGALDDAISMQEINEQIKELATPVAGVTEGLDKWHNRLREITDLQNKLNKLTGKNNLLQKDGVANGGKIYDNLQKQLDNLEEQVSKNASLAKARRKEAKRIYNKSGMKDFLQIDSKTKAVTYKAFDSEFLRSIDQTPPEKRPTTEVRAVAEPFSVAEALSPISEKGKGPTDEMSSVIEQRFSAKVAQQLSSSLRTQRIEGTTLDEDPNLQEAQIKFTRSTDLVRNEEGYLVDTKGQYIDKEGKLRNKKGEEVKDGQFGQLAVKEGADRKAGTFKIQKGENMADVLERLTKQGANGETAYTAEEQFQILTAMGLGNMMQYDESGNRIYDDLGSITQEQMQEAVKVGIARLQSTVDDINEQADAAEQLDQENLELRAQAQEIVQSIIDNQMELENKVLQAVEDLRQTEIDNAQKERDAYAEATSNLIDGLSSQLQNERDMYSHQQDEDEVARLQRQIAILQRSGGSGSQIQSLQSQLASKQQDMYFDERQAQIDKIKEASDAQLEKMDHQIEIMTETLQYEKENGLLWAKVAEEMNGTPSEIAAFISQNTKDYASYSALALQQQQSHDLEMAQTYSASVADGFNAVTALNDTYQRLLEAATGGSPEEDEGPEDNNEGSGDQSDDKGDEPNSNTEVKDAITAGLGEEGAIAKAIAAAEAQRKADAAAEAAARETEKTEREAQETQRKAEEATKEEQRKTEEATKEAQRKTEEATKKAEHKAEIAEQTKGAKDRHAETKKKIGGVKKAVKSNKEAVESSSKIIKASKESIIATLNKQRTLKGSISTSDSSTKKKGATDFSSMSISLTQYKTGGLNTKPGLAWLDGTKSKPEYVLNPEQTAMLRESLFMSSAVSRMLTSASALPSSVSSIYDSMQEESIEIGTLNVNVNVPSVASDYDSRRIGEIAMEEMMQIARKHGARGLSRR